MCTYIYIYICIERKRERHVFVMCVYVVRSSLGFAGLQKSVHTVRSSLIRRRDYNMYIYIYIYICIYIVYICIYTYIYVYITQLLLLLFTLLLLLFSDCRPRLPAGWSPLAPGRQTNVHVYENKT